MVLKIIKKLFIIVSILTVGFLIYAFFVFGQGLDIIKGNSDTSNKTDKIYSFCTSGRSMEPTSKDGDCHSADSSKTPKIGDLVDFQCFTEKCINGEQNYEFHGRMKRLADINSQGCYYFLGDNPEHSWDSRNYGWLCPPDDVKILGVVIQ